MALFDAGAVVLGDALFPPARLQGPGAESLRFTQGCRDQYFQARRIIGIVINAQVIDDQRQRRLIRAKAHRTQKTILYRQHRQTGFLCFPLGKQCAWLATPRQQHIGLSDVTSRTRQ
ncbi:hypothetical protein D3C71_1626500 [compost metagenome]